MAANEDWLKKSISRGLQALVVLHLEGGPSAETVTQTAGIWVRVIKSWPISWDEQLDRQRLTDAFLALASQATRWPSPKELRLLLPARKYPQAALPKPDYPPEKAKENLQKIRKLLSLAFAEEKETGAQREERLKQLQQIIDQTKPN